MRADGHCSLDAEQWDMHDERNASEEPMRNSWAKSIWNPQTLIYAEQSRNTTWCLQECMQQYYYVHVSSWNDNEAGIARKHPTLACRKTSQPSTSDCRLLETLLILPSRRSLLQKRSW